MDSWAHQRYPHTRQSTTMIHWNRWNNDHQNRVGVDPGLDDDIDQSARYNDHLAGLHVFDQRGDPL
ncbi:MAG: hypothetical protein ACRDTE_32120, partial [Pseudonocardiaceae bacterium]